MKLQSAIDENHWRGLNRPVSDCNLVKLVEEGAFMFVLLYFSVAFDTDNHVQYLSGPAPGIGIEVVIKVICLLPLGMVSVSID